MYDIGIIGGMGPKATSSLLDIIVNHTDANTDQEHPSIIIINNTKIPDRTTYIFEERGVSPLEGISEAFNILSGLVKPNGTVGMVCNTAHHFYSRSLHNENLNFINMPYFALKYIQRSDLNKKVCVLCTKGTRKAKIYESNNPGNIEIFYPNDAQCEAIQSIIYQIKDTANANYTEQAKKLVEIIKKIGNYTFVLACTELSVLDKAYFRDISFVDAMDILAMLLIRKAGYKIKTTNNAYNQKTIEEL